MKNDQLTRGKLLRIGGLLLVLMSIIFGTGIWGVRGLVGSTKQIEQAEDAVSQALIADNLVQGARVGAVVGMEWKKPVTGDMAREGVGRYAQLSVSGNRVR